MGVAVFFAASLLASLAVDLFNAAAKPESLLLSTFLRPVLTIAAVALLMRLYIVRILRLPLSDFRIRKPKSIAIWILCAAALPLGVSGFFMLTPGTFGVSDFTSAQIIQRIVSAVLGSCLAAGITEELVFRGFIMRLAEARWNKSIAIIAPSALFASLHVFNMPNPNIADIIILLAAGTCAGAMFSMIAYQSGSIWPGAIVHGFWNLVVVGGILKIGVAPERTIFTYTLSADSALLTGGAFGIEASLPAVIGYGAVILLAWLLRRKQKT
jgi:membrane protease YdiL (CAAX protease family)